MDTRQELGMDGEDEQGKNWQSYGLNLSYPSMFPINDEIPGFPRPSAGLRV